MIAQMLAITEFVIAIGAIALTCATAGRIPAMALTAVATAAGAIIMPPFLSWEVESDTDIIALVFQSIVGLLIAYRWPAKVVPKPGSNLFPRVQSARSSTGFYSLSTLVRSVMEADRDLSRRLRDVDVYGDLDKCVAASQENLKQVLSDVLIMAFTDSKVQHVTVFAGRQPARDRITVVAEYDLPTTVPLIRLLGRSDDQSCVHASDWPPNCSATYFDNGHEYIYLISIYKYGVV